MKRCPKCRLVSPEQAARCDCGFDFAAGELRESYLPAAVWERIPREVRTFAFTLTLLGAALLLLRGLAGQPFSVLGFVIWAAIINFLALQFSARKRWARTALAMLTLPIGFFLFQGRYSRYLDRVGPG